LEEPAHGNWQPKKAKDCAARYPQHPIESDFVFKPSSPPEEIARRQREHGKRAERLCACGRKGTVLQLDFNTSVMMCTDCFGTMMEGRKRLIAAYWDKVVINLGAELPKHPRRQYLTRQHPKTEASAKFKAELRHEPLIGGPNGTQLF